MRAYNVDLPRRFLVRESGGGDREFLRSRRGGVIGRPDRRRPVNLDIELYEQEVSRKHAEWKREGADLFLRDLGSFNGTWIDGKRLDADRWYPLPLGARVQFGGDTSGVWIVRSREPDPRTTPLKPDFDPRSFQLEFFEKVGGLDLVIRDDRGVEERTRKRAARFLWVLAERYRKDRRKGRSARTRGWMTRGDVYDSVVVGGRGGRKSSAVGNYVTEARALLRNMAVLLESDKGNSSEEGMLRLLPPAQGIRYPDGVLAGVDFDDQGESEE